MNLKEIRVSKGLSQREASLITNIPLRTYKRIENGSEYKDSLKYLKAIEILNDYTLNEGVKNKKENIVIIGAGYVGLANALLLARNHNVTLLDIDQEKIKRINDKQYFIHNKFSDDYVNKNLLNLKCAYVNENNLKGAKYYIIAVPTNTDESSGLFDMSIVLSTIKKIREVNKTGLIIIKSTCYGGFTKSLNDKNVIVMPEFLTEANALKDALYPSRIVVGVDNKTKQVKDFINIEISSLFMSSPVLFMSSYEAEMVKLYSNAYLAMRVSYFNNVDSYAMEHNLNSKNIIQGISLDPRIGDYYNNPSFGYGGYCLPKDTLCLSNVDNSNNLVKEVISSNESRFETIVNQIASMVDKNKTLGALYKKENRRNDPLDKLVTLLINKGYRVISYTKKDNLSDFFSKCDLVLVDKMSKELLTYKDKIFSRDLFSM